MPESAVAIVTGSTSGIGFGIAESLAAEGMAIMLNGFGDAAEIERMRSRMASDYGVRVAYNGADMASPAQVRALVEEATRELGSVDVLVNNAGIQYTARVQ